jgi:putative Holliday junction resolvase
MAEVERVVALDVGEKRIGVAFGDSQTKIAVPETTLSNDADFLANLGELIRRKQPVAIVVGLPRNSKGQETKQSEFVREFAKSINVFNLPIVFQDESLTTVEALSSRATFPLSLRAKRSNPDDNGSGLLRRLKPPRNDGGVGVDAKAAALILSDYLESKYA